MAGVAALDPAVVDSSKLQEVDGNLMIIDGSPADVSNQSRVNSAIKERNAKKALKRKRDATYGNASGKDTETRVTEYRCELDELFEYYKEVSSYKLQMGEFGSSSINSAVACLIEESNLPFSKLVEEVYEKLKVREGTKEITLASIRSSVLFVGQRMMYGVFKADADVLEDESQSCLWCWETRDKKLLPTSHRGTLNLRHICRKKIHERISALSVTLSALSMPESNENYRSDVSKACEKLGKALNVTGIRSLLQKLKEKHDAEMVNKESKLKEKESIKESEKNKRSAEKEKKRMDRELEKERLQTEKETKRLQDEVLKEERRREKEEAELKKKLKKQQEEAERDQRQWEKEESELKRQLALKKQAAIMERFLNNMKCNNSSENSEKVTSTKARLSTSSCRVDVVVCSTASLMDRELSSQDNLAEEYIRRSHVANWHKSRHSITSHQWNVRRNPKTEVIKELKLQGSSIEANPLRKVSVSGRPSHNNNLNTTNGQSIDKLANGYEGNVTDDTSCHDDASVAPTCGQLLIKKLLQFDKSHRPAYYGTWHRKSLVVGPRHPLKKDPDLDYDVDSDEEWEEDDPGESLSDCDKEETEFLEEGNLKSDEDEGEDGFFVPDGYLSENEVIQADSPLDDMKDDEERSSPYNPETENEEFKALFRQQKYLQNLTDLALRKSQPFIVLNLMHEKSELVTAEDLIGAAKLEQICLQALCIQACNRRSTIDVPINPNLSTEDQEVQHRKELEEFIGSIRANPQGINKVLESLQRKFPTLSKSQLKNKVREISNYNSVDNRWKVKREVLVKLGLPILPDERRKPSIPMFFSKRCLPPEGPINVLLESSQPSAKTEALGSEDNCSE